MTVLHTYFYMVSNISFNIIGSSTPRFPKVVSFIQVVRTTRSDYFTNQVCTRTRRFKAATPKDP